MVLVKIHVTSAEGTTFRRSGEACQRALKRLGRGRVRWRRSSASRASAPSVAAVITLSRLKLLECGDVEQLLSSDAPIWRCGGLNQKPQRMRRHTTLSMTVESTAPASSRCASRWLCIPHVLGRPTRQDMRTGDLWRTCSASSRCWLLLHSKLLCTANKIRLSLMLLG